MNSITTVVLRVTGTIKEVRQGIIEQNQRGSEFYRALSDAGMINPVTSMLREEIDYIREVYTNKGNMTEMRRYNYR